MGPSEKGVKRARVRSGKLPERIKKLAPLLILVWLNRASARRWMTGTGIKHFRKRLRRELESAKSPGSDVALTPLLNRICCSEQWSEVCATQVNHGPLAKMALSLARRGVYPPADDHLVAGENGPPDQLMRRVRWNLNTLARRRRGKLTLIVDQFDQGILWPPYYIVAGNRSFERMAYDTWRREGRVYNQKFFTTESPSAEAIQSLEMMAVEGSPVIVKEKPLLGDTNSKLEREIKFFNATGLTEDDRLKKIRWFYSKGRMPPTWLLQGDKTIAAE